MNRSEKIRDIKESLPRGWAVFAEQLVDAFDSPKDLYFAKEKFGELRVRANVGVEMTIEREAFIEGIRQQCSRTCMECGSRNGDIYFRRFGWCGPVCESCIIKNAKAQANR